jgi:hypothetical protein
MAGIRDDTNDGMTSETQDGILKSVPYWFKHLNATNIAVASKMPHDTARRAVMILLGIANFRLGLIGLTVYLGSLDGCETTSRRTTHTCD